MTKKSKKKVLVAGSGAAAFAVARRLSLCDNVEKVYSAGLNHSMCDFAEIIDIREDNVSELLEFAINNEVDLTVAASRQAIKADIAGFFQANEQNIFAPSAVSAQFALSKSYAKKFLYKRHIPAARFGVFEKPALALDYLKNCDMPVIISSDETSDSSIMSACSTFDFAKIITDDMAMHNEPKIVIEDYVQGHNFTVYAVTDGYNVLPAAVCADYKFAENGGGGALTCGSGAFSPDYKISSQVLSSVLNNIKNTVVFLEKKQTPYLGILGVECILTGENNSITTGFTPFFKDHDAQVILNCIDENLYTLFEACAVGSFADDYEKIKQNDFASVAVVLFSRNDNSIISGLDMLDDNTEVTPFSVRRNEYFEYETNKGRTLVVTHKSSTLASAKRSLYENIDVINFNGKKFRSDICN